MTTKPEQRIRRHLDEHGGQTDASVRHVLATFGVDREDEDGRRRIETSLGEAGVEVKPRLAGLADDAAVVLSATDLAAALDRDQAPWGVGDVSSATTPRLSEPGMTSVRTPTAARSRGKLLAIGVAVVVLAAGAFAGGYFMGEGSGEDLDAARAAGAREGARIGAARGAERGYNQGFREGRREGYKQTFDKAYDRAYNAELEEAGFEPVKNPSDK